MSDSVWFRGEFREGGEAGAGDKAALAFAPVVATPERSDMGGRGAQAVHPSAA